MNHNANTNYWGNNLYLRSALCDWCWIVLSSCWAIALGWLLSQWLLQKTVLFLDTTQTTAFFFYMALTQGHLLITVFRTHANPALFNKFYWRFTLVPLLVYAAAISNHWMFASLFVVSVFWDVYHSSLQVFGFARIYDRKAGNDPQKGRRLDYLLCLMIYAGPVLGGLLLLEHLAAFGELASLSELEIFGLLISAQALASAPDLTTPYLESIRILVIGCAAVILIIYFISLQRLSREGYRLPLPKLAMFISTAIACVFAWGFNSFAMGFLIANIFHAVQYFAFDRVIERESLGRVPPLSPIPQGALYVLIPFVLGLLVISFDSMEARALVIVCALMHFWWDGFIWSVRTDDGIPVRVTSK
jgi:hypothetical protein